MVTALTRFGARSTSAMLPTSIPPAARTSRLISSCAISHMLRAPTTVTTGRPARTRPASLRRNDAAGIEGERNHGCQPSTTRSYRPSGSNVGARKAQGMPATDSGKASKNSPTRHGKGYAGTGSIGAQTTSTPAATRGASTRSSIRRIWPDCE